MTKSEQATLRALGKSLLASTKTDWKSGDVNAYSTWAYDMRSRINTTAAVIIELCNLEPTKEEEIKPLNLD